jgi:predicted transcriptional regulator
MSAWTDELKAKAIEDYQKAEPTGENSMDIVNEIAEEMGMSPNGVRMILSKAGVYVAKTAKDAAKKPAAGGAAKTGGTKVSKEGAHGALKDAIEAAGKEADMEIISKLTGKAAVYFTSLFKA